MSSESSETEKKISILLVDRSERSFADINELLKRLKSLKYCLDWANSFEDGIKHIETDKYDVCLLDQSIDDSAGLAFLKTASDLPIHCAVILLSDGLSIDGDMAALRAGATDYLQKARLQPGILHRAIRFALHRQNNTDTTEILKQKISKLLRAQAVSEIASGIADDLANLLIKIDQQFQLLEQACNNNQSEAVALATNGRSMCKQAYQLAENIAVCTNPDTATQQSGRELASRKRILVIDSNFNLLEVAKLYLEAGNLDNKCFSNPVYALEWYRQHYLDIDGVILDCSCPPLSTSDCLKQLMEINPKVKVVLCANKESGEYRKLIKQGALRFFEKPAGYPSMVSWLVEALHNS